MPTMTAVDGADLKQWMTDNGWTVRGLASRLGVDFRTVQRWRDGSSRVPPMAELALSALDRPSPPTPAISQEHADAQDPIGEPERIPFED